MGTSHVRNALFVAIRGPQGPSPTHHGVGFNAPREPLATADRTSRTGAVNMKFAITIPAAGQT